MLRVFSWLWLLSLCMRKQTLILTTWLALPFLCLLIIMGWIFISLDKDRLMDEPPVGAGAGDTGNANALGQLFAGRDPNAISDANDARRDGKAVDPFNWPGGTLLTFTHQPPSGRDPATLEARIVLETQGKVSILIRPPKAIAESTWGIQLDQFGPDINSAMITVGYRIGSEDTSDWPLTPISVDYIVPGDTLSSDPIEIPLRIDVIEP